MRLIQARNLFPLVYVNKTLEEIYKHGFDPYILDIQIEHTPAGTSLAEVSAPTAVFDGTTLNKTLAVVSSSANDTDAADKDVREVTIIGIDKTTGKVTTKSVKTSGVTANDVTGYFERIFHAYASDWGSNGADAAGNITIGTHGYQELGLSTTLTTASGLAASTQYYFKLNVDGGGVTEYDFTTSTDVTIGGVIDLINTALSEVAASLSLVDGDLRFTSTDTIGSSSTMAVTAGTTGTDLLATLTGFTSVDSAVDGVVYLTISAGDNESNGAAFYVPDSHKACSLYNLVSMLEAPTAGDIQIIKVAVTGGVLGSDPDSNVIGTSLVMSYGSPANDSIQSPIIPITEGCKVTIQDAYITNGKKLSGRILWAIYPNVKP